jgi:CBS domain-containing protein
MEITMNVSDCMTREVRLTSPDKTLRQAAEAMAERDVGMLPVGENDRLIGMITDRDIAIRGVAAGKSPEAKVREVMSSEVKYCYEDQPIEDVLRNMGELQVRRLPVLSRDKRLVGILSLCDASADGSARIGETLDVITAPGGRHNQAIH